MNKLKFKTNAKCGGCTSKIDASLKENNIKGEWSFDREGKDIYLIIETDETPDAVKDSIKKAGYTAE
ncbi:MAG: heavy metal transport/detoxification protein [Bacteroidales bacterium]|nr:heavy metal transport/detoxification protein [Bacteroidales bacterium]